MTAESITAIAAVIVALVAVAVSVWEGLSNRRHNRLSVKPALAIQFHNHTSRALSLVVINTGLGPGFIDRFDVFLDTVEKPSPVPLGIYDASIALSLERVSIVWTPEPGEAIAAGMELPLIVFEDSLSDDAERIAQIQLLQKVEFHIRYSSVYGDHFMLKFRVASRLAKSLT